MKEIGAKLRAAREAKNISLEDIQIQTKIRLRYLEAIESGNWEVIPGEVYRRGFVCSYAGIVGLDGEELLREYQQAQTKQEMETTIPKARATGTALKATENQTVSETSGSPVPLEKSKGISLPFLALIGVFLAGSIAWYLLAGGIIKHKPVSLVAKPKMAHNQTKASTHQRVARDTKPQTGAKLTVQQIYPAPLTVYAEFSEKVWVQVTTDGQVKYLDGGFTFTAQSPKQLWTANREMEIRVGNSGGLRLTLNGKDLGVVGERGQPRTVTITANGAAIH